MRRADRLFQIVLLLGRGRVLTAASLAERLEVSERTIYRDVQDLMASGVPIDGEPGLGYALHAGFQVPPLMFDDNELEALVFGVDVAKSWGDPALAEAADRILAKVDAVLPERLRPKLAASRLFVPDLRLSAQVAELLGEVRGAIGDRRRVFIDYRTAEQAATERIIWPMALAYWGRTWTLGGWCELRQDFRSFRLDRIIALRVLESTYEDLPGRGLAEYVSAMGGRR